MGKIVDAVDEMAVKIEEAKKDAEKFEEKGVNAAGTRVRKAMQEVRRAAQLIRVAVTEKKNS